MRQFFIIILAAIFLVLIGCSKESLHDPADYLETYVNYWNKEQFSNMYALLSDETIGQYRSEDFIDRYKQVYEEIGMSELKVNFSGLPEEEIKNGIENKEITFQVEITMESIAGNISFTEPIMLSLVENEEDEEAKWVIHWSPTLILPNFTEESSIKIKKTKPRRGDILDRNRMPLAINDVAYEIGLVPDMMINEQQEINQTAQLLQMNTKDVERQLNADWVEPHHFVPIKTISNENDDIIQQLRDIPSVKINETEGRSYPLGEKAAHLIGYIGQVTAEELEELDPEQYHDTDVIGKRGLEQIFEERLRGEEGIVILAEEPNGNETVIVEKPVKNGEIITLTIDINVQEKVFDTYEKYSGTAVVLDPHSGEVLSLTSFPSFNPSEFTYGLSQSKWEKLLNDREQPLINRFTSSFAPGSALKPITAAIGLNNNVITHDEAIEIEGLKWGKDDWNDYQISRVSESTKPVDLKDAIVRSDNIFFAMKSLEIGGSTFETGLRSFGFEEDIPFSYPIKQSQISNSGTLNDDKLLANTSYGQGEIEVSPLHIALLYAAFVNDGNVIKPVLEINDIEKEFWLENVLSSEDATKLTEYLRSVVTDGTAKIANKNELEISGKTSTVELKLTQESKGHINSWFIGFPTKDEDIIIAMMLEKTDEEGSAVVTEAVADLLIDIKNNDF